MTADSPKDKPSSPVITAAAGDGVGGNPQSRSTGTSWVQFFRSESESKSAVSVSSSPSSSSPTPMEPSAVSGCSSSSNDDGPIGRVPIGSDANKDNASPPKRFPWNLPSNGVVEGAAVMGGSVVWPALDSSLKSSLDSSKPVLDKSASVSQGPIVSSSPKKQTNGNTANSNVNQNRTVPVRHKKHRDGNTSVYTLNGFTRPPPTQTTPFMPPSATAPMPGHLLPTFNGDGPAMPDLPARDPRYQLGVRPPHFDKGYPQQRNSFRRNNNGPRPRGDGYLHNNNGGRPYRDGRDIHMQRPAMPPPPHNGFVRSSPPPVTYSYYQPAMRPYATTIGFDMASTFACAPVPLDSFSSVPYTGFAQLSPMYYSSIPTVLDDQVAPALASALVNQIDYYFSDENLVKDSFLRSKMDDQGWVPIDLIATFRRVREMTNDVQVILRSLRSSVVVEVRGAKIRRRNEWRRWIMTADSSQGNSRLSSLNDAFAANLKISADQSVEEPADKATATVNDQSVTHSIDNPTVESANKDGRSC